MSVDVIESSPARPAFAPPPGVPVLKIRPTPGWRAVELRELWRYRELLYFLVWRDIKVRYKQTALGAAWALIQPLFNMLVFTVLFGRLAGLDRRTGGIPYPVFSMAALVPWTFFANSLSNASNSLVNNANMISKIYFPRLLIPSAAVVSGLVDYLISLCFLGVLIPFYPPAAPTLSAVVMVPLLTLLVTALALGVSLWLSALNVQYRDIRYTVPFLVQLWMFVTPVVYPMSLVPEQYRWLASLNPMAGIVEGFRSSLLGQPWDGLSLAMSVVFSAAVLVSGCFYFRRLERSFADVI